MEMSRMGRACRIVCPQDMAGVVDGLLRAEGFEAHAAPFHSLVRIVSAEPAPLGGSLAARLGLIYIQDRSSMLPPLLLAPPEGSSVLDMCSAPGSKTGFLAQFVGPDGMVFGNEPNPQRLGILRNNLRRLSLVNTATANCKGEKLPFAEASFSHILLDPPCSGWGTENKHPGIRDLWTGEKTKPLIRLQRKLLERAAAMLRPGGKLVYSTCTTNPDEDERQAAWAASELGLVPVPLAPVEGFVFEEPEACAPGTLKVADEDQGQGFYVAAFTLPGEEREMPAPQRLDLPGTRLDVGALSAPAGVDWDALPDGEVWDFGGRVFFLPQAALDLAVSELRWQGMAIGRVADGEFRPDGLCRSLLGAGAGVVDLEDVDDLKALLEGRGIAGPGGEDYVGIRYQGLPLGWTKAKSGRLLWSEKQVSA